MNLTTKNVLTFLEAVEYTGYKKSYLYKLTAANTIPVHRPFKKKLFFKREELESFLTGEAQKNLEHLSTPKVTSPTAGVS